MALFGGYYKFYYMFINNFLYFSQKFISISDIVVLKRNSVENVIEFVNWLEWKILILDGEKVFERVKNSDFIYISIFTLNYTFINRLWLFIIDGWQFSLEDSIKYIFY